MASINPSYVASEVPMMAKPVSVATALTPILGPFIMFLCNAEGTDPVATVNITAPLKSPRAATATPSPYPLHPSIPRNSLTSHPSLSSIPASV